jgi:hypothetical protein
MTQPETALLGIVALTLACAASSLVSRWRSRAARRSGGRIAPRERTRYTG